MNKAGINSGVFVQGGHQNINSNVGDQKVQVGLYDGFKVRAANNVSSSNITNNKSITERSVELPIEEILKTRVIEMERIEVSFDDLPEAAKPLVQAVINSVDPEGAVSAIFEEAEKYFISSPEEDEDRPWDTEEQKKEIVDSERLQQQRSGIYRAAGRCMLEKRNSMDDSHKAVFMAILNAIHGKDEKVQKAILEPIANRIVTTLAGMTGLSNECTGGVIEVEPITRAFFNQAYHLTQKNDYLLYTVENKEEGSQFYDAKTNRQNITWENFFAQMKKDREIKAQNIQNFKNMQNLKYAITCILVCIIGYLVFNK